MKIENSKLIDDITEMMDESITWCKNLHIHFVKTKRYYHYGIVFVNR